MWFRRRRRQQPPVLLPPVDRLAELVNRVVTLLDETPAPAPEPVAAERSDEEVVDEHVVFVPGRDGYRLLVREGTAPARGDEIDLDEVRYRVLRLGPSPLPGDRRRCAFLEQEPAGENRSPTGAGGESDRGHEGGAQG